MLSNNSIQANCWEPTKRLFTIIQLTLHSLPHVLLLPLELSSALSNYLKCKTNTTVLCRLIQEHARSWCRVHADIFELKTLEWEVTLQSSPWKIQLLGWSTAEGFSPLRELPSCPWFSNNYLNKTKRMIIPSTQNTHHLKKLIICDPFENEKTHHWPFWEFEKTHHFRKYSSF